MNKQTLPVKTRPTNLPNKKTFPNPINELALKIYKIEKLGESNPDLEWLKKLLNSFYEMDIEKF